MTLHKVFLFVVSMSFVPDAFSCDRPAGYLNYYASHRSLIVGVVEDVKWVNTLGEGNGLSSTARRVFFSEVFQGDTEGTRRGKIVVDLTSCSSSHVQRKGSLVFLEKIQKTENENGVADEWELRRWNALQKQIKPLLAQNDDSNDIYEAVDPSPSFDFEHPEARTAEDTQLVKEYYKALNKSFGDHEDMLRWATKAVERSKNRTILGTAREVVKFLSDARTRERNRAEELLKKFP